MSTGSEQPTRARLTLLEAQNAPQRPLQDARQRRQGGERGGAAEDESEQRDVGGCERHPARAPDQRTKLHGSSLRISALPCPVHAGTAWRCRGGNMEKPWPCPKGTTKPLQARGCGSMHARRHSGQAAQPRSSGIYRRAQFPTMDSSAPLRCGRNDGNERHVPRWRTASGGFSYLHRFQRRSKRATPRSPC